MDIWIVCIVGGVAGLMAMLYPLAKALSRIEIDLSRIGDTKLNRIEKKLDRIEDKLDTLMRAQRSSL